jgi:geranylgeranyl diphosphate synthase type I
MEQYSLRSIELADAPESRSVSMPRGLLSIVKTGADDAALLDRFERAFEETVLALLAPSGNSPIAAQVRWHFGIGSSDGCRRGKRLRPRLLLQIAMDEGATFEQALDAALAVEYLHNYSLVHDDIEDGDELRHDRQSVWARFGLSHGINVGDSLGAVTYLTLLRNSGNLPAERVNAMAAVLHRANLAMCAGQGFDIAFESASHVGIDEYLAMIDGKTAVLFGAACELGAICAGADEYRAVAYREFGRSYGRAFQIRDDVLGTWGSVAETGKPRAGDIARRKWSYPIVWALGGVASDQRSAIAGHYSSSSPLAPADIDAIVDALDALGARRAAIDACEEQIERAERLARTHGLDESGCIRAFFDAARAPKAFA